MTARAASAVRAAIRAALPRDTSTHGASPEPRHMYVPPAHVRTLQLDHELIIGGRGVGKTFWSTALASDELRSMLGTVVSDLQAADVFAGYGERSDLDAYPDPETFASLLDANVNAFHVWRAVVARGLADRTSVAVPAATWSDSVAWVRAQPEAFARLLQDADTRLRETGSRALFVFDALDRAGRDWRAMNAIVRDLLRVALTLKTFSHLHTKVFLRDDQFERRTVTDFPDASKLLATRVELTWEPHDLHGLLWQYLCNAPDEHGDLLRDVYTDVVGHAPDSSHEGVPCTEEEIEQRWNDEFGERFRIDVSDRLPPDKPDDSWRGLRVGLERLGIMEAMRDARITMPDLYQVGFGLGRRGGVRPVVSPPAS